MKKICYYTDKAESLVQLSKLCIQLIQRQKYIFIHVDQDKESVISDNLWKSSLFFPHGIYGDTLWQYQPVIVGHSVMHNILERYTVCINFENMFIDEYKDIDIIMWNCKDLVEDCKKYQYVNAQWILLS